MEKISDFLFALWKLLKKAAAAVWASKLQVFAFALIIGLACSDFITMHNMFIDFDLHDSMTLFGMDLPISEPVVFSATCAILLEGLPTFMGIAAAASADPTMYKSNDRINSRLGVWIALVFMLLTFVVVSLMRYFMILQNGGFKGFTAGTYGGKDGDNSQYIAHIYLLFLPMLTSGLAFAASWIAFRSEKKEQLERRINGLHKRYLRLQSSYLDSLHKCDDAVAALWTSLSDDDKLPKNMGTFRTECFKRIRSKLIETCIMEYPAQIARYDAAAEVELKSFLERMGSYTTVPTEILDMSLQEILKKYDEAVCTRDIDKWKFETAELELEKELKKILDNAVIVAQYKTSGRPYYLEGDRY